MNEALGEVRVFQGVVGEAAVALVSLLVQGILSRDYLDLDAEGLEAKPENMVQNFDSLASSS